MGRIMRAMTGALAMPALAVTVALAAPAQAQDARRLTVTGWGEIAAAPDMATVTLGVTEAAPVARDAMDAVSRAVAAVLAELEAAGIAPADMQTSDLSMNPVWTSRSDGESRITGFEASSILRVRVRDLDRLGATLDAVLGAGANRFQGLSFGLSDPGPVGDAARRAAVADAIARAALYADAAGVALGPVLSLSEGGASAPLPMMREMAFEAAPMPIAQGEVTRSASVTMVFAIAD